MSWCPGGRELDWQLAGISMFLIQTNYYSTIPYLSIFLLLKTQNAHVRVSLSRDHVNKKKLEAEAHSRP